METKVVDKGVAVEAELKEMLDHNRSNKLSVIWHSVKIRGTPNNKNTNLSTNLVSSQTIASKANADDEIVPENSLALKHYNNYDCEDLSKNSDAELSGRCRLASEELMTTSNDNLKSELANADDVEFKYKTYLYKPKEKFAVAINFHPLAKLIYYKNVKSIKKEIKRTQCSSNRNSLSQSYANNNNTNSETNSNTNLSNANESHEAKSSKQRLTTQSRSQRPKSESCDKEQPVYDHV